MSANYRNPNWLLPNELNQSINPSLSESRKSLYSMNFNGSSDCLDLGNPTELQLTSAFSISLWINYDNTPGPYYGIDGILGNSNTAGNNGFRVLMFNAKLYFYVNNTLTQYDLSSGSTVPAIVAGDWHHFCFVYDGTNTEIFIDNTSVVTGTASPAGYASTDFKIARAQYGFTSYYFDGQLDEVAIWNKALSATEVAALSTASAPANLMALSAKPVAYYPLGEFAGNSGEKGNTPISGQTNSWKFPNQAIKDYVFDFDGSDKIETGISTGTDDVSISYWMKTSETHPYTVSQCAFGGTDLTFGTDYSLGRLGSAFSSPNDTKVRIFNTLGTTKLNDGNWHHVVFTYDYTTKEIKAYVDSNLDLTVTNSLFRSKRISIGSAGNSLFFTGAVSQCALFNSALPATGSNSVETLYNNGSPLTSMSGFTSLQSWYKLNAATSSYNPATSTWTITDSAGSNNGTSTTLSSTSLIPSDLQFESPYSNFSLDFDGTSSYLNFGTSIGDSLGDNYSGGLSVSLWFKAEVTNGDDGIFGFTNGTSTPSGYGPISAVIYQNKIQLFYGGANKEAEVSFTDTTSWHHLVATFDTNLTGQLYLDNSPVGSSFTYDPTNADFIGTSFYVGNYYKNLNNRFTGKIDEVALWKSSLTAAQVNQIYNNGRPGDLTSLSPISWSRLGEDAFFVNNNITIPNQISGGPTGTGSGTQTAMLSADAPQSYGGGYGVGLAVTDKIGDAPNSTANSLSYNMIPDNRHAYTPSYAPAKVDNAFSMSFNGTDEYINLGTTPIVTGIFSISMWIKRNSTSVGDSNQVIIGKDGSSSNRVFNVYFQNISGSISFWVSSTGTYSVNYRVDTSTLINDTNWHHVVLINNGDSVNNQIFIDGVEASYATQKPGRSTLHNNETVITSIGGDSSTGTTYNFNGKIDEVAFFNYALTAKQIKEDIYNASKDGKTADLSNNSNLTAPVAWYRMGD